MIRASLAAALFAWASPLAVSVGFTLAVAAVAHAEPTPTPSPRARVTLVVLGHFDSALVDAVAAGLRDELQVEVVRGPKMPLPRAAWYAPRRRWRAEKLIAALKSTVADGKVLGLTDVDISTTKAPYDDWGVFGLGEVPGRGCVVSAFRLRRGVPTDGAGRARVMRRVVDVAQHEVGHTLGLPHCSEPHCLMNDAEGSIRSVDESSGHLGPACRARLAPR